MMQSAKKTNSHSRDSSNDSSSDSSSYSSSYSSSDSRSSNSNRRRHSKQAKRAAAPVPSVAAERAIGRVFNASCPYAVHLVPSSARSPSSARAGAAPCSTRMSTSTACLPIGPGQAPPVQAPGHPQPRAGGPLQTHAHCRARCCRWAAQHRRRRRRRQRRYLLLCLAHLRPREPRLRLADLVRKCLDATRADAGRPCGNPLPWRECLQYFILYSEVPALVAYLADWAAADARDEACVRAALLDRSLCLSARWQRVRDG